MPDKKIFAQTLKYLLEKSNTTQVVLAAKIEVSVQAVNSWCVGKAYPECSTLLKIADFFRVSTDYLLTGHDIQIQNPSAYLGLDESACELIRQAMRGSYGNIGSTLNTFLSDKKFYQDLSSCVKGIEDNEYIAAFLMFGNNPGKVNFNFLPIAKKR